MKKLRNRSHPLYEGKAKILFAGPDSTTLIQHFKDDATAFNNAKRGTIEGKGVLNNLISEYIFQSLTEIGLANHFLHRINMREQLVRRLEMIPLEVIVRNIAAGSFTKRYGCSEGTVLPRSIVEYCLKDDKLGDPTVGEDHITAFGLAHPQELDDMLSLALRANDFLQGMFRAIGLRLVDFKLEFGRSVEENGDVSIWLADEISPDTCRLWDRESQEKLDKDRFRCDLGGVEEAYREVARRLGILPANKLLVASKTASKTTSKTTTKLKTDLAANRNAKAVDKTKIKTKTKSSKSKSNDKDSKRESTIAIGKKVSVSNEVDI